MDCSIAFFDIDGTLLDFGAKDIRPATERAMKALQARGCKLFLATGRPPFNIPRLGSISFDGALCFNGSYGYDSEGAIFSHPIDKTDMRKVIENARSLGIPALAATPSRSGSNFYQDTLDEYMRISGQVCNVAPDYEALLEEDVYQLMIGASPEQEAAILAGTASVSVARWWDRAMDVIPADSGKATGIEKILERYGLERENVIAFGDGGNDLDMLEFAGLGIAMGNALPHVREAADYVTDDCAHDGVATALTHFGLV